MVPPPPSTVNLETRRLFQEEGIPVFKAEIKRLVAFERAPLAGVVVKEYSDPRAAQAWLGYEALGKEVLP
jgi:chromosome partitioning protein